MVVVTTVVRVDAVVSAAVVAAGKSAMQGGTVRFKSALPGHGWPLSSNTSLTSNIGTPVLASLLVNVPTKRALNPFCCVPEHP